MALTSQELAEEVEKVVEPLRDQLDAVVVFPSMPEVMRLNKVGSFTMQNLGQSKSVVSDFMKKKKKVRVCMVLRGPCVCSNRGQSWHSLCISSVRVYSSAAVMSFLALTLSTSISKGVLILACDLLEGVLLRLDIVSPRHLYIHMRMYQHLS